MPLTVLGDDDVNRILHSLNKKDIEELQENLADALHWYSTSNDANDCCSDYQPERTHMKRKDGSTTLFMPASGMTGQGVKVSCEQQLFRYSPKPNGNRSSTSCLLIQLAFLPLLRVKVTSVTLEALSARILVQALYRPSTQREVDRLRPPFQLRYLMREMGSASWRSPQEDLHQLSKAH